MTKKESMKLHAKRRALERYDLQLTREVRGYLQNQIKKGNGKFLRRQSRRVTLWEVKYNKITYRVAYDTKRHTIITFLPEES